EVQVLRGRARLDETLAYAQVAVGAVVAVNEVEVLVNVDAWDGPPTRGGKFEAVLDAFPLERDGLRGRRRGDECEHEDDGQKPHRARPFRRRDYGNGGRPARASAFVGRLVVLLLTVRATER